MQPSEQPRAHGENAQRVERARTELETLQQRLADLTNVNRYDFSRWLALSPVLQRTPAEEAEQLSEWIDEIVRGSRPDNRGVVLAAICPRWVEVSTQAGISYADQERQIEEWMHLVTLHAAPHKKEAFIPILAAMNAAIDRVPRDHVPRHDHSRIDGNNDDEERSPIFREDAPPQRQPRQRRHRFGGGGS